MVQLGDKVRCKIPNLHLDFVGMITEVRPDGAVMVVEMGVNCHVLTNMRNLTPIGDDNDGVGRLATPTVD